MKYSFREEMIDYYKIMTIVIAVIVLLFSWRYYLSENNDGKEPISIISLGNEVQYVEWDTDGKKLGSVCWYKYNHSFKIHIWDYPKMQLERIIESENFFGNSQIIWSPDGSMIAINGYNISNDQGVVHLYNTSTWELKRYLTGNYSMMDSIDWSGNGNFLGAVSATGNYQYSKLVIWDTSTWGETIILLDSRTIHMEWHPNNDSLATAQADNTVRILDKEGHQIRILNDHNDGVNRVRWSPQANLITSTSTDGIFIYDTSSWNIQGKIEFYNHTRRNDDIAWNPEGNEIASTSGSFPSAITIFSIESYDWITELFGQDQRITKLSWNIDNDLLASSSSDGTIMIWNV